MNDDRFFPRPKPLSLAQVVEISGAELRGGLPEATVDWIAPIEAAGKGALSFIDNPRYAEQLGTTAATACFCAEKFADRAGPGVALLVTAQPYEAFAKVAAVLYPDAMQPPSFLGRAGLIDEAATVHSSATLEDGVTVESGARIGAGASVGRGSVIGPNCVVAAGVQIGRNCVIGPNASIQHALIGDRVIIHSGCAIGQDGFGFAMGPRGHRKVPQIGRVIIQDDVEIGANSTIDRGANRDTIIGEGTKIDNLVQIAHNDRLGRHCVLAGQAGISGSVTLGDFVVMGGRSAVKGHVDIGDGAQIGGASEVYGDVPSGARWAGTPAMPVQNWLREIAARRMRSDKRGDEGKNR